LGTETFRTPNIKLGAYESVTGLVNVVNAACGAVATDMDIKDRIGIIGVVVVSAEEVATELQFFCACPRV